MAAVISALLLMVLLPAAAIAQPFSDAQPSKATLAIVGGYLIDGHEGPPIRNSIVLVDGAKILAVGTTDSLKVPPGAKVIDAAGYTVMPGLIDSHVHIDTLGMADYYRYHQTYRSRYVETMTIAARQKLLAGTTTILELGAQPEPMKTVLGKIERGEIPGPRIRSSMGWFLNTSPEAFQRHFTARQHYTTNVHTVEEARAAVLKAVADGAGVIKQMGGLTPEQMRAVAEEAHKNNLKVTGHVGDRDNILMLVRNGLDGIEHGGSIDPDDEELIRELRARRVTIIPTNVQSLAATLAYTEEPGWVDSPKMRALTPPAIWSDIRETLLHMNRLPYFRGEIRQRRIEEQGRQVKRLYDLGLRMVAGTDSASQGNFHTDALWRQMELLVRFGIPPMEVISMTTRVAAEWVGVASQVGTIEPGKLADIIVVDGNPLTHMRDMRHVVTVIKGGVQYAGAVPARTITSDAQ